jgi:nitrite reductase (NO-forming)
MHRKDWVRRLLGLSIVVPALIGLITLGCTSNEAQQAATATTEVKVVATEWKFEPLDISVPAGTSVKFVLTNEGQVMHNIDIKEFGFVLDAAPGQTASKTLTVKKAGDFRLVCSLPGHAEAGMAGTLNVGEQRVSTHASQTGSVETAPVSVKPALNVGQLPAPRIAAPVGNRGPAEVKMTVEAKEVSAVLDDGVTYNFWTFDGTVPGPMLRARQGDTVELTLRNASDSTLTHSIDLHAVTGPGGGAKVTQVEPGKDATFRFQALNPGVYVYHCATPMIAHHVANGMYGLIVVEPPGGLPAVDREFYVMEGDFYLQGAKGAKGHREFSLEKMLAEQPDYVLFNGRVGALTKDGALKASTGETVRIFFGAGGPNLSSSFHVIGEVFDRVYPEGASEALTNVQTTTVPAGGATMVEFKVDVPGSYILVDHSLARVEKGGAGILEVEGPEVPGVFEVVKPGSGADSGH